MNKGIFIVGTDTEVGKTYISALIIKALQNQGIKAGYFKAALSGDIDGVNDGGYVKDSCNLSEPVDFFVPYIYETAVSPHLAGKIHNNPLDLDVVAKAFRKVSSAYEYIVAEGSGGILCPLRYDDKKIFLEDIIKLTGFEVIIVANSQVGAINATVLTAEYAKNHDIPVAGIILNNFQDGDKVHENNLQLIKDLTQLPILATVPHNTVKLKDDIMKFLA